MPRSSSGTSLLLKIWYKFWDSNFKTCLGKVGSLSPLIISLKYLFSSMILAFCTALVLDFNFMVSSKIHCKISSLWCWSITSFALVWRIFSSGDWCHGLKLTSALLWAFVRWLLGSSGFRFPLEQYVSCRFQLKEQWNSSPPEFVH